MFQFYFKEKFDVLRMFQFYFKEKFDVLRMFQFYFKEKFDVLRMFRLLVSSRYRRVKKKCYSIWFYLLYLFIQYLKRVIHQSFIFTVPTYEDSRGKAGVRCWTITF